MFFVFIDYEDIFFEFFGLESVLDVMLVEKLWMFIWDDGLFDYDRLERCFIILERYLLV